VNSQFLLVKAREALQYHQDQTRPISRTKGMIVAIAAWLEHGSSRFEAKIVDCRDPLVWYADKIGHVITIEWMTDDGFWSREPSGCINIVFFEDVELITNGSLD